MTLSDGIAAEIRDSLETIPFVRAIAPELVEEAKGCCRLRLPLKEHFFDGKGALSPGLIAGLLDQLGSETLSAHYRERNPRATLSMALSFAERLECAGALEARGTCLFAEGGTGSVSLEAVNEAGRVLAHGHVVFMIGAFPGSRPDAGQVSPMREDVRARFAPEEVAAKTFNDWMNIAYDGETACLEHAVRLTGSTGPVIAFHGGVVAGFALAAASEFAARQGDLRLSGFSMEYLRAAKAETLAAATHIVRPSRRTLVLATDLTQEDGARHVARAVTRFVEC